MSDSVAREPREQPWTVRKSVNEALKNSDLPDLDEREELEDDEADQIESGIPVDVFDHCHKLAEKGDVISYRVYRNNQLVGSKPHPYSWDKLQVEFGEGHYRVEAKSERTKRFLKQQTNFVAAPTEPARKESVADAVRAAMPPKEDPFDNIAKMASLLRSLTPTPPPPPEDKTSGMMIQFMQTMMQMQTTAQTQVMTMVEKMQENTNRMVEKLSESQKEMLTKIESKIATGGGKEKSLDPLQILTLMQQAEKRGMDNFKMIEEMAERRARSMSGNDDDKEPETATEKMIRAVLPAVTSALAQPAPQRQMRPVMRRTLQPGVAPATPTTPVAPVTQPATSQAAPMPQPRPAPRGPVAPTVLPKVTKEQVLEKLMPPVLGKLIAADAVKENTSAVKQTQMEAAKEVQDNVKSLGITLPATLQLISIGDILDLATSSGLPPEAHTWLKGFYANLKELAGPGTGPATNARQPQAQGQQPPRP